jgi:hypothetical protein
VIVTVARPPGRIGEDGFQNSRLPSRLAMSFMLGNLSPASNKLVLLPGFNSGGIALPMSFPA